MSTFNPNWLTNPDYIGWLNALESNPQAAFCKPCHKIISLSNMGKRAITSHASSMKHKQYVDAIHNKKSACVGVSAFFGKTKNPNILTESPQVKSEELDTKVKEHSIQFMERPSCSTEGALHANNELGGIELVQEDMCIPPPPAPAQENQVQAAPNVARYLQTKETRKAEILWALKCVMSHFSFCSNEDISELFKIMFHDSNIAQNYSCGYTKMAYLITFGIAVAFRDNLKQKIQQLEAFSISFDEALNSVLQLSQMDLVLRFWQADKVVNRYIGSQFLDRTRAQDLLKAFNEGTSELDLLKLLQVGMDGPNVNIKMIKLMIAEREEQDPDMTQLLEIGVCSLHVLHGGLQTGVKKTGWSIDKLLRSLYWLFHDSHARRGQYTEISKSTIFPLNFCSTRWTEDKSVAQRAISIMPNIKKYVKETLKKKKSEIPTCASFAVVQEAVLKDKLLIAKLEFFVFVATFLKPFLTKYQTDEPLILYLSKDISLMLNDIMGLFVNPEVLRANQTSYKLATLDITDKKNRLDARKINVGNGAREAMGASEASQLQKFAFQNECLEMLCALVGKIQERCPLKYGFVRALQALDPSMIVANTESATPTTSFRNITRKLISAKIRTTAQCDRAEMEYRRMIREQLDSLTQFDPKKQRIDQFYYSLLNDKHEYAELWQIVQRVLVLSHGQAQVERGFSVNADMLQPNMKKETLVALRLVYDTIMSSNMKIHEFKISDKMLQHCNQARAKYDLYRLDQKKAMKQNDNKRKCSEIEEKLVVEQKKLKNLEDQIESCVNEGDKKAKQALKKQDFKLLAQSVALKEKAEKMRKDDIELQKKKVDGLKSKLM